MVYTHFILLFYWIVFCSLHSFLALRHIKSGISRAFDVSERAYRIVYNSIAFLSLAALLFVQVHTKSKQLFQPGPITFFLAMIIMAGGLLLMMISIRKYFAEMSGLFRKTGDTLETAGLHQFVRHPLYLGTILFTLSLCIFWPAVKNVIALAAMVIYTRMGISLEEKKLVDQFGEQYLSYRNKVPMLLPRLYSKK